MSLSSSSDVLTILICISEGSLVAYSYRGIAKEDLGDLNGACADWRKAASLGHSNSAEWGRDQCN